MQKKKKNLSFFNLYDIIFVSLKKKNDIIFVTNLILFFDQLFFKECFDQLNCVHNDINNLIKNKNLNNLLFFYIFITFHQSDISNSLM